MSSGGSDSYYEEYAKRDRQLALDEMRQINARYEQAVNPITVKAELCALGLAARRYLQAIGAAEVKP